MKFGKTRLSKLGRLYEMQVEIINPNGEIPEFLPMINAGTYDIGSKYPGTVLEIDAEWIRQAIKNREFEFEPGTVDMYIEDGHDFSEFAWDDSVIGWGDKLEARENDTQLWMHISKLTEWGAEMLSSGRRRYTSIVFVNDYKSTKTGELLGPMIFGVGLTNRPMLPNQLPIAAAEGSLFQKYAIEDKPEETKNEENTMDRKQLCKFLGLAETTPDRELLAAAMTAFGEVSGTLSLSEAKGFKDAVEKLKAEQKPDETAVKQLADIRTELKLEEGANVLDAVKALAKPAEKSDGKATEKELELTERMNKLELANGQARAEALIEKAMKEGKIAASMKDDYLALAVKDFEATEKMIAKAPKIVPMGETAKPQTHGVEGIQLTEGQREIARRLNLSEADYAKGLKKQQDAATE